MKDNYKEKLQAPVKAYKVKLQDAIPLPQPWRIMIDPADVCNFECNFCFQHYDKDFRGGLMSEETFDKIVESLEDFPEPVNVIHFYALGEPLLNKLLPSFIAKIKEKGLAKQTSITTNGSLFTRKLSQKLIASGIDRISISLNGLSDTDFLRIVNRKVSFEKLYEEIRYLYSIRQNCHIHVKINGDCFAPEEHKRFTELFGNYADSVNIDNVVDVWPGLKIAKREVNLYDGILTDVHTGGGMFVCPRMFYELVIHPDGSVSPCCLDYDYKGKSFGNVHEKSLKEIWSGNEWRRLELAELKGEASPHSACNICRGKFTNATVDITPYREEILKRLV